MKKYILLSGLLAIILTALTACQDIYGSTARNLSPEPAQEVTNNEATSVISWQEAYAEILHTYSTQPATTANIQAAEWRFMLHDVNQNGVPQLFLVRYHNGQVSHHTAYSILNGSAMQLKTASGHDHLYYGGMYIAPGGTGIIRYASVGLVSRYEMLSLSEGGTLSPTINGDTSSLADSFRKRAMPVTQEEFEDTFGRPDERVWLVLHEISEASVQDVVFGW